MNVFAYFLIIAGALQFASIGYDEYRGVTRAPMYSRFGILPGGISKKAEPEKFHNAIVCHCYNASAFLFLGILIVVVGKRMDKSDPMSPDFAGNKALDDWAKAMKEEEERRKVHKK
ncbi:MAG: hypothetical protein NTZ16_08690 [Verrucomicrobia bacterium]|nr:hypothetical protein [Verrucomicrobiota bacterium]